jgi:hypothetical protein
MVSGNRRLAAIAIFATAAAALIPAAASAAPAVTGTFKVAGIGTNNKDVAGPDGNIWVTLEGKEENVARVTPTGEVKEFKLGLEGTTGIAVGPEGKLWVTAKEAVASFETKDPENTKAKTEITAVKADDSAIVTGPEHKMWVATEGKVLRFPAVIPVVAEEVPVAGLTPHDIDSVGGTVAVADGLEPRIITFTTTFVPHEIKFGAEGGSQGLAIAPTGQIGFSDPGANPEQIGLVTPPAAATTQEQLGDPFGVAYGEDGAFWFAQFNDGEVVRLSSTGQKTFVGGLPKMSARQITTGPGHTLWVTLVAIGEEGVARISGVEPPPVVVTPPPVSVTPPPVPNTKLGKAPKHKVTASGKRTSVSFRFSSPTAGTKFECALTKALKGKKAKRPHFAGCASPKNYRLSLGNYRFQVRAVGASGPDASPAGYSFRIVAAKPAGHHRHGKAA